MISNTNDYISNLDGLFYSLYIIFLAMDVLDWTNSSLVERYYYYLGLIINLEAYLLRLNRSHTEREIALISEIQLKKSYLSMLDNIDSCSNTKPDTVKKTNTSDIESSGKKIDYSEWYVV